MAALIRKVEQARTSAESNHLRVLASFAERAYRRPLSPEEQAEQIAFYQSLRRKTSLATKTRSATRSRAY